MANQNYSSANKAISVSLPGGKVDPKALLSGMTKDVRKRWMIVGGVAVVVISLAGGMLAGKDSTPRSSAKKESSVVETTPKGLSNQADWKAQTGAEMLELKKSLAESHAAQREVLARLDALNQELAKVKSTGGSSSAGTNRAPVNLAIPAPPTPPKTLMPPGVQGSEQAVLQPTAPVASPQVHEAPAQVKRAPAKAFIPVSAVDASAALAQTEIEELVPNDKRGYLPANSFVDASLISGVEALTGGTAQSQPQPIVIRLNANAILPNSASYDIKGCHVLASVWGDLSSERVFGRLATLTCVDAKNRLVLSEEVQGVLVDSDGKNGIRGKMQDRQSAKLGRALLAGFAEGMASAFGSAQSTVSTTAFGTTTSLVGSDVARAAGYTGASKAAEQLADFYMKQAEATMPIIAVDAGRKISVLFTQSKALKFESTDAYRPKQKERVFVERKVQ